MKTFLSKIFQLEAISEVTLLSTWGEILLSHQKTIPSAPADTSPLIWNELIASLGRPRTADFLFARGRYFLQQTAIGYLIVGMRHESSLNKVKIACSTVRQKLTDPAIRKQTLLKLLVEIDDAARPQVIKELMPLADRDVARILLGLLRQQSGFQPRHRDRLLLCICQALGDCGGREALEPLKALLGGAGDGNALSSDVENGARIAIRQLEQETTTVPPPLPPAAPQGNRRRHERRTASILVSIALLDDQENDIGKRTKGDLRDISLGGLALSFHACQHQAAGMLLGKKVRITENRQDSGPALVRTGIVKAIGSHGHLSTSYLMHLQFTQQLTAAEMQHVGTAERMLS